MSLYREAGSGRRRLWFAVGIGAAALVVLALVLGLTRGGERSEADLQDDAQPALAALDLVPIHYESPNAATHAAAATQLAAARDNVSELEDELRERDAAATAALLGDLDALQALVTTRGRTAEVERASEEAAADLRALVGLAKAPG